MSIPFMEEPDMDMPDIDDDDEEDVAGAAEPAEAGMTATADGIRMTANTAPRAPRGFVEMNLAATVGSSARSGTSGKTDSPINAMIGPLFGSVPPNVSTSPNPSSGDPVEQRQPDPEPDVDAGALGEERSEPDDH